MSVKLVLLKSGEDVVTEVKTVVDNASGTWYYQFDRPYVVHVVSEPEEIKISADGETRTGTSVRFVPWIPLTDDNKILVNHDWIVSIVTPVKDILDSYLNNRRVADGNGNGNANRNSSSSSEE
jgi:hypothetical protein